MSHSSKFLSVDSSGIQTYSEIVPTWVFQWFDQDDDWIWRAVGLACGGLLSYHYYQKYQQEREEKEALREQLEVAQRTLTNLKGKLLEMETNDLQLNTTAADSGKPKKQIRVWLDGVFDMMHFGHMNAFRQARSLGTHLVAGVCSSEDTARAKGAPVCSDEERINTVRGCKWVDEIVSDVSYTPNYTEILEKHNIDYIVHGDDLCIVDGKNVYEEAIKLGKFLTIPRTEGISTTEIVGRMLAIHHTEPNVHGSVHHTVPLPQGEEGGSEGSGGALTLNQHHYVERPSEYLTTARIIRLFGAGVKPPKPTDRVVYIAGTFDMFHAGHVEILEKARKLGDYLIVGVYNDQIANGLAGANFPVLSMFERILSVLGCKFADDVLFNASYEITQEMIASLQIQVVVQPCLEGHAVHQPGDEGWVDPYVLPRKQGILQTVTYKTTLSVYDYINRIESQRDRFETRYVKKMEKEKEFYNTKYHL